MKKTKTQKGITLVALILTIVVLLILAVVAIIAIQNTGIFEHANNAATQYNQKQEQENAFLNEYENFLNNYAGNSGSTEEPKTYTAYTVGQVVTVKGESFYVIEDSDEMQEMVVLLSKEDVESGSMPFNDPDNPGNNAAISYPDNLNENGEPDEGLRALKYAYDYGKEMGGKGRLLTYAEAIVLDEDILFPTKLSDSGDMVNCFESYWLATASSEGNIYYVFYAEKDIWSQSSDGYADVRPVIEISKDLI